jgi:hypothetical protein
MKNIWLWLHYSSIVVALSLVAVQALIVPQPQFHSTNDDPASAASTQIAVCLLLYGFVSGMILMARRKGESERIWLAISTLTPLVLPAVVIAWELIVQPR